MSVSEACNWSEISHLELSFTFFMHLVLVCMNPLGGLVMELSPAHVCEVPGTHVTFTCSYRSSERLEIEFVTSRVYRPGTARVSQLTGRDITARHSWGAMRKWTVELGSEVRMVTCRVVNLVGLTVGQLHARVKSGENREGNGFYRNV